MLDPLRRAAAAVAAAAAAASRRRRRCRRNRCGRRRRAAPTVTPLQQRRRRRRRRGRHSLRRRVLSLWLPRHGAAIVAGAAAAGGTAALYGRSGPARDREPCVCRRDRRRRRRRKTRRQRRMADGGGVSASEGWRLAGGRHLDSPAAPPVPLPLHGRNAPRCPPSPIRHRGLRCPRCGRHVRSRLENGWRSQFPHERRPDRPCQARRRGQKSPDARSRPAPVPTAHLPTANSGGSSGQSDEEWQSRCLAWRRDGRREDGAEHRLVPCVHQLSGLPAWTSRSRWPVTLSWRGWWGSKRCHGGRRGWQPRTWVISRCPFPAWTPSCASRCRRVELRTN